MPCAPHEVDPLNDTALPSGPSVSWCGGWGYIVSVDVASNEIVFDLAQLKENVPGDESQGWEIVNANPRLRTLPIAANAEIRACQPEPAQSVPGEGCGNPWVGDPSGFELWTVADLAGFVAAGHDLWNVQVDPATGEVMWIEQWWSP